MPYNNLAVRAKATFPEFGDISHPPGQSHQNHAQEEGGIVNNAGFAGYCRVASAGTVEYTGGIERSWDLRG